jgi:hypothetical protein
MKLRVGDWVEVRSQEEILETLDKESRYERLPFMPQMFQYCGRRFQVFKRAHKTCDWIFTLKSRHLPHGVHLNLRCDGAAYGGCQAACLLFWKEAWLKRPDQQGKMPEGAPDRKAASCTPEDVMAATQTTNEDREVLYFCQGTELPDFTKPISRWNVRQYWEDYSSGNVTLRDMFKGLLYAGFWSLSNAGIGLGRPLRWFYELFQFVWGPYPRRAGKIPQDQPTPSCDLDLQPGELVRVKSYEEILATLNRSGLNRGLYFDAEQVPYCGGTYRVRTRMTTFIDEKTRKIRTIKNPCIILEGVWCQSKYSHCRMYCPRAIYSWWHEIWLERVPADRPDGAESGPEKSLPEFHERS